MLFIVKILGYFQANRETKKEGFTASQREFCHTAYYCSIALLTPKQWLQHDHNICDAVGEQKEAFVSPCFLLVLLLVYSTVVSVGGFYLSCSHLHYQFFKQITQTLKIPCEAEISAAVIYKQSQQMCKGESSMAGERVVLRRRILKSLL